MLFQSMLFDISLPIFFVANVVGAGQEFYIVAAPTKGPAFFGLPGAWCSIGNPWSKLYESIVNVPWRRVFRISLYQGSSHRIGCFNSQRLRIESVSSAQIRSMPAIEDPLVHKSGLLKRAVPPTGGICHQSPKKITFIPANARKLPSTWANHQPREADICKDI